SNNALKDYLDRIGHTYPSGKKDKNNYFSTLESFVKEMYKTNVRGDVSIDFIPKKGKAVGIPDMTVKNQYGGTIGYVAVLTPFKKLDETKYNEELKRYMGVFPNLVITNLLEFRLYRWGARADSVTIGALGNESNGGITVILGGVDNCFRLFREYLLWEMPDRVDVKWMAEELAKRTKLLRDDIVLKALGKEQAAKTKGKHNLRQLYDAFKAHLIPALTLEEFADMYSQSITFGVFTGAVRHQLDYDETTPF
ncbi:MAG: hypothetical protein GY940_25645, partial [bacterium]|nr:hypothetical protein [bacterium]